MTLTTPPNSLFEGLDQLLATTAIVIDRPAGSAHPRYPEATYPVDYGYLDGTTGGDGDGIDVFVGTATGTGIVAAAVTVDVHARDAEVKALVDCGTDEIRQVERFLTRTLHIGVHLVRRDPAPAMPLMEFDPAQRALIEPSEQIRRIDVPAACVVTFFGDSTQDLLDKHDGRVLATNEWADGPHPLIEIEHDGQRLAVLYSGVGAPLAAGLLEEVIAMGCRAFVVCGGAGALREDLTVGHLVVVRSALRDEGTSHHYQPASRRIDFDLEATRILEDTLIDHGVPFVAGTSWTTDAPYRETPAKIAARRAEGCLTVEMEAAALAAVAQFRHVPLAQVLYGGDDLTGETWDSRDWTTQRHTRDNLLRLAGTAALRIAAHNV